GDSFFHDADVASIEVRPDEDDLVLRLFTLNDLEDINTYRCAKGMALLGRQEYRRAPVLYTCRFRAVTDLQARITLPLSIMDTELDRGRRPGTFCVRISFSEQHEMSFDCAVCTV